KVLFLTICIGMTTHSLNKKTACLAKQAVLLSFLQFQLILLFSPVAARLGDGTAHIGICLDILHPVVVHHTQVTAAERLGHRQRHLRLGFNHLCTRLLRFGTHFLFGCHGHGPAFLCSCISHFQI